MPDQPARPPLVQVERRFASDVARATGFDPRVVYAWIIQEGAYAPGGTKGLNFLNLRPQKGDPYTSVSSGGFERFSTLQAAEQATIHRIRQLIMPGITSEKDVQPTAGGQIEDIATSAWDEAHYSRTPADQNTWGSSLVATFTRIFGHPPSYAEGSAPPGGTHVTSPPQEPGLPPPSVPVSGSTTIDPTAKPLQGGFRSALGEVTGGLDAIKKAIEFIFSGRFLELLGGAALLVFGGVSLLRVAK